MLRANRAAVVASIWLPNPFTALPTHATTYLAGRFFLPGHAPIDEKVRLRAAVFDDEDERLNVAMHFRELGSLGGEARVPLVAGGFIVGLPLAIVAFILNPFWHRLWLSSHSRAPRARPELVPSRVRRGRREQRRSPAASERVVVPDRVNHRLNRGSVPPGPGGVAK
ncbi:MAG: DUF2062 domain-containing protein [Planctomycetota bacterium]